MKQLIINNKRKFKIISCITCPLYHEKKGYIRDQCWDTGTIIPFLELEQIYIASNCPLDDWQEEPAAIKVVDPVLIGSQPCQHVLVDANGGLSTATKMRCIFCGQYVY